MTQKPIAVDGRTQLVGLIGWPTTHSLSPAMHNRAFETLGLNWRYVPLRVPPGGASAAVRGLAALGFRGANVTVPHKSSVGRGLHNLTGEAKAMGAVNTVFTARGEEGESRLVGHNTDSSGFMDALVEGGFDPHGETALVLGAGGVARAAVFALLKAGASRVTVLARRVEQAETLAEHFAEHREALATGTLGRTALAEAGRSAALIVHATPVGLWPHHEASVWPEDLSIPADALVYDLVYVPRETKLLRHARACGARCLDGVGMLVHQGARAFSLWTGRDAPVAVMRQACEEALRRMVT